MNRPFEDPRKTEMRGRCEVAIDVAGHDLAEIISIRPPEAAAIHGSIKGDLQSVDGDGLRYCYYLRPGKPGALPQWIASIASAAQEVSGCEVYVVVEEISPEMIESSRSAGAGLLLLTEDDAFDWLVDPSDWSPDAERAIFIAEVKEVRRLLEARLSLNMNAIQDNFSKVQQLTQGFSPQKRDEYVSDLEQARVMWSSWSDDLSARLDAVAASRNKGELELIKSAIEAGPLPDDIEDTEI